MKKIWKSEYTRIVIILLFFVVLVSFLWVVYQENIKEQKRQADQKLLAEIQAHYGEFVVTKEDANLYCKDKNTYVTCGTIAKDYSLQLKSTEVKDSKQQYFEIEDSKYYVFYLNVEKIDPFEPEKNPYLTWNQVVEIKENTPLMYQNAYVQVQEKLDLPLEYQDHEYYYVSYMNHILKVSKEESQLKEQNNNEEKEATQIPILFFEQLGLNSENDQKLLAKVKENHMYSISLTEYERWKNGEIRLLEHAVLLLAKGASEIEDLSIQDVQTTNLSFQFSNRVSKREDEVFFAYRVPSNTPLDTLHKMLQGETIMEKKPQAVKVQKVPVLNYHFFYDPTKNEGCNENICLTTQKFEEQLTYLKQNGYQTLTMEQFRAWMYGEIEVPEKSVLLTVDDGAFGTGKHNGNHLIPILEKYDMHATLFLITGWWSIENYRSPNLDIESHTNDMHTMLQSGAQLLNSTEEQVKNDLQKSIAVTNSTKAFCFPFYAYNDTAIRIVKEAGFSLAFVGGNYKASRNNDKYKIPRYPIYKGTTLQQFINMIS